MHDIGLPIIDAAVSPSDETALQEQAEDASPAADKAIPASIGAKAPLCDAEIGDGVSDDTEDNPTEDNPTEDFPHDDLSPDELPSEKEQTEPIGEGEEELTDAQMAELLANPMFLPFARGRKGDLGAVCRDFHKMLAAGGLSGAPHVTASVYARMTPTSVASIPEVALSEHQRDLARAAGMSYREYYELSRMLPNIKQK